MPFLVLGLFWFQYGFFYLFRSRRILKTIKIDNFGFPFSNRRSRSCRSRLYFRWTFRIHRILVYFITRSISCSSIIWSIYLTTIIIHNTYSWLSDTRVLRRKIVKNRKCKIKNNENKNYKLKNKKNKRKVMKIQ